jgi:hypothetical protein
MRRAPRGSESSVLGPPTGAYADSLFVLLLADAS